MSKTSLVKKIILSEHGLALILMKIRGITLVIKFLSTLFIAHYIGFEALGLYGLITAATIVVPILIGLGIMYTLCRKAVTLSQEEIVTETKYYIKFITLAYIPLTIAALIYGILENETAVSLLIVFIIFFEHINGNIYQLQHNLSKPIAANIIHFIRSSLWMILFMLLAYFNRDLRTVEVLLIFWACGSLFAFGCFLWSVRSWPWLQTKASTPIIKWILCEFKTSRNAYYNGVLDAISMYLDRYVITFFLGLELTGVYVFFWSIISAMSNLIRTGVLQVARPKIVKAYKESAKSYEIIYKACKKNVLFSSLMMSLISIAALYFVLPYMNKPETFNYLGMYYIMVMSFVVAMMAEVIKLKFYSQHRDDLTLKVSAMVLVTSVISNFLLIPVLHLLGAAIAMTITSSTSCAAQLYLLKVNNKVKND